MGQFYVLSHLAGMTLALLGVFGLYRVTLASRAPVSVFHAVYANCILVLVSLVYYCIGRVCHAACTSPVRKRQKKMPPDVDRVDLQRLSLPCGNTTQLIMGVPKLTIHNVWILVYGLGLVFFITGYCILGLHPVCLACAGLAMGVLSVDELICPRDTHSQAYSAVRFTTLLVGLVSLILVSADLFCEGLVVDYVVSVELYSIAFGLILPFCAQFLMILVRDSRNYYTLGTVLEACEFGFPFTAFLGVFHLSVAYGQRSQIRWDNSLVHQQFLDDSFGNYTSDGTSNVTVSALYDYYYASWYHNANITNIMGVARMDGPFVLFYALAPLFTVPSIVCYVSSVLDGRAIDPLLSLTMALCVERLIDTPLGPASTLSIYGTACCALAFVIRVLGEYKPRLADSDRYNLQAESTQLTERAIKERDIRLAQEAIELEELSQELGLDQII